MYIAVSFGNLSQELEKKYSEDDDEFIPAKLPDTFFPDKKIDIFFIGRFFFIQQRLLDTSLFLDLRIIHV